MYIGSGSYGSAIGNNFNFSLYLARPSLRNMVYVCSCLIARCLPYAAAINAGESFRTSVFMQDDLQVTNGVQGTLSVCTVELEQPVLELHAPVTVGLERHSRHIRVSISYGFCLFVTLLICCLFDQELP